MTLSVRVIGYTKFDADGAFDETGWSADSETANAQELAEFAGRACYQSWDRPNPATSTNEGYLDHILSVGHLSVIEHGSVSVYVKGVSRSFTHELIRHRHMSYSQLSQRFVVLNPDVIERTTDDFVVPPLFAGDPVAEAILLKAWEDAVDAYGALLTVAEEILVRRGANPRTTRKEAREAARAVLPNMTPTAIVITGNHRSWREFLQKRGGLAADAEIRQFAVVMYEILSGMEPNLYQDITAIEDDVLARRKTYLQCWRDGVQLW